ncbi:hypothetical protein ACWD5V_40195 [Streptomyces sp. NPDC002523]
MPEMITKAKILCCVVREGSLFVHRHTDFPWKKVGVQVPADS